MLRALRPAVLLTLALAACAKPAAECPPGTAEHGGACRSTCRSDDQCLLGEHCTAGFCEAGSADAAVKPDGGTLDALGAPDAVDPGDAEPFKDAEPFEDAEVKDVPAAPDADQNDTGPSDLGMPPVSDAGFAGINLANASNGMMPAVLTIGAGAPVPLSAINSGTIQVNAYRVVVYLNPGRIVLSSFSGGRILPGNRQNHIYNVTAPPDLPTGLYNLVAEIDPENAIAETDEGDNILALGQVEVESLLVTPDRAQFQPVTAGCGSAVFELSLQNKSGFEDAVVASITVAGDMSFTSLTQLPLTLPPGAAISIRVSFDPPQVRAYAATLQIQRAGAVHTVDVNLSGAGVLAGNNADYFLQTNDRSALILLVVDDTSEAQALQDVLAQEMPVFVNDLGARGIDATIGVTLTDGRPLGTLVGLPGLLSSAAPTTPTDLSRRVAPGTAGHGPSAGIEASLAALSGGLINNAWTGVIYASPVDDASSMANYPALLAALLAPADTLVISAIVPDGATGCGPVALRYLTLVSGSGGSSVSACSMSFASVLGGFGGPDFGLQFRYHLHGTPAALPVSVFIDGRPVADADVGYDSNLNDIVLSRRAIAQPGSTIEARYAPSCGR